MSEPEQPSPKLLTIQQAADRVGVHYQTIRNWIKRGQIEYCQWGNTVRIPAEVFTVRQKKAEGEA